MMRINSASRSIAVDFKGSGARQGTGTSKGSSRSSTTASLGQDELQLLSQLKSSDRAVRAHEQAHLAAAGSYARSGANYQFTVGPDGQQYAVAGEVSIDTSAEPGDPEATIHKAEAVRAAALAPADPSPQDRQVAAAATQMEAQAWGELLAQQSESQAASEEPSFDAYA